MTTDKPKAKRKAKSPPLEIGWCELVGLPELGLEGVRAKIDTGAATSSIHGTRVKPFERDGQLFVEFWFRPVAGETAKRYIAPAVEQRRVRSSNGQWQQRFVIETTMKIGNREWLGHMTLANRRSMAFPILIGRRALRRGFVVNSAKRWTQGRPPKTEKKT